MFLRSVLTRWQHQRIPLYMAHAFPREEKSGSIRGADAPLPVRNVLVVGGTSGIGLATSVLFGSHGDHVIMVGRPSGQHASALAAFQAACPGGSATWVGADIAEGAEVDRLFRDLPDLLPMRRLDVAVNAAAIAGPGQHLVDVGDEDFEKVIATNLIGTMRLMRGEARLMRASGKAGAIINIGSVSGVYKATPGTAAYSASKAAILALTRVAANELAEHDIRVVAVLPGNIDTPLFEEVRRTNPLEAERRLARIPLRRLGQPQEVAEIIHALASAPFITGAAISIDGGTALL